MNKEFNITLSGEQLQVVMNLLADGKFSVVQPIIANIVQQLERQQDKPEATNNE